MRPSRWGLEYADACANSVRYQGLDAKVKSNYRLGDTTIVDTVI